MKKGMTLVELTVAMAIFITITTLVVGAFVTVTRMKSLTSAMRESQQKVRVAMEMVTRLSRQAEAVNVESNVLTLFFTNNDGSTSRTKFIIADGGLYTQDWSSSTGVWTTSVDLVGGETTLDYSSRFTKVGGIPPTLNILLNGKIGSDSNSLYYSNTFNLDNTIILEGVK